jgi:hypothetical protein
LLFIWAKTLYSKQHSFQGTNKTAAIVGAIPEKGLHMGGQFLQLASTNSKTKALEH